MNVKKPSSGEDEYFAKVEADRQEKEKIRSGQEQKEEERELHWMRCPKCGKRLEEIDFRSIRIDRCSACGGVWLDGGELEAVAGKEGGVLSAFFQSLKSG